MTLMDEGKIMRGKKSILITGATDGIGKALAFRLAKDGHRLLLHGRNANKLDDTIEQLRELDARVEASGYLADLSKLEQVAAFARKVTDENQGLDVLINNAGVLKAAPATVANGLDVRFVVNTFAPALLTQLLWKEMPQDGRIIQLSSAAQSTVSLEALKGERCLQDMEAYSQSKLALTMWSAWWAKEPPAEKPLSIAVNPGSLLATNMVKSGFGIPGSDVGQGVDALVSASLSAGFSDANGKYFDNDAGAFASPHPDASDQFRVKPVVDEINRQIDRYREG